MLNKFKLWFSRNDIKIIAIIVLILSFYGAIKMSNNYYKNQKEEEIEARKVEKEKNQNKNNSIEELEKRMDFPIVEKSTEEYTQVMKVMEKIMNNVYEANKDTNNKKLRQDIYNMFTPELIDSFYNQEEEVNPDSILNYIFIIDNMEDYSIGNIYKYSDGEDVKRYGLELRYKKENEEPIDSYTIINIDYNNHTFSYDGTLVSMIYIDRKDITEIENKGSNTF